VKNPFGIVYTLLQVLVLWVRISDWSLVWACISFYRSPWKLRECSRLFFWQNIIEPSMTCLNRNIPFLLTFKMSKRWHQLFMSSRKFVPMTLALMCLCPSGKNTTNLENYFLLTILFVFSKQATLMERSAVLNLPSGSVFHWRVDPSKVLHSGGARALVRNIKLGFILLPLARGKH
jgi:hypothetical protein